MFHGLAFTHSLLVQTPTLLFECPTLPQLQSAVEKGIWDEMMFFQRHAVMQVSDHLPV